MKFPTMVVVVLFCIFATAQAEQVPAFAKALEDLHQSPSPSSTIFNNRAADVQIKWITQKLDHFSELNRTWQMRYMENNKYFKDGGPIFIFLGGEGAIQAKTIQHGIIPDLAKEHNGILFQTEHRYYGESKPMADLSVENMQYLYVRQALADLAHLLRTKLNTDPRLKKSKVIISSCSYAASMALWFSQLYPDLVNGVFASSAPIMAKVDFNEYLEVVGQALQELGSQKCYDRIKNITAHLEVMLAGDGAAEAKRKLNLCDNFNHNNVLDLWTLFAMISMIFAGIVQNQSQKDVSNLCNKITSSTDDLSSLAEIFSKKSKACIDATYNGAIHFYNTTNHTFSNYRPWHYQSCNEFGWFKSSASNNQPFGSTLSATFFTRLCYDLFGSKYTRENIYQLIDETNKFFGGNNSSLTAKNIYMTQGTLDPWRPVGYNVTQGVSVIPKATHCDDLGSISKKDSHEMRASKERLFTLVRKWLA